MNEIHRYVGYVVVGIFAIGWLFGLVLWISRREAGSWFWRWLVVAQIVAIVQALGGLDPRGFRSNADHLAALRLRVRTARVPRDRPSPRPRGPVPNQAVDTVRPGVVHLFRPVAPRAHDGARHRLRLKSPRGTCRSHPVCPQRARSRRARSQRARSPQARSKSRRPDRDGKRRLRKSRRPAKGQHQGNRPRPNRGSEADSTESQLKNAANYFYAYHEWMIYLAQSTDHPSPLRQRFDEHLKTDASGVPVLSETFESYDHVNVQRAIDRFLSSRGRKHDLVGVAGSRTMRCRT